MKPSGPMIYSVESGANALPFRLFASFGAAIGCRKGGINDLGRWKQFGGTLERPLAPAPMVRK